MSTHNICFYGELEKIIPESSSNTTPSFIFLGFDTALRQRYKRIGI